MGANSQKQKRRENTISLLDAAIEALNLAKEVSSATPAKAVFGSVGILLTTIKDSMANKTDYVELGLSCADVCGVLHRGMNGKTLDDLSQSVREAIGQLMTTVAEIQAKVAEKGKRNLLSRLVHAKNDKDTIAGWKSDINRVLQVFTAELVMNTHVTVSDIRHDVSKILVEISGQVSSTQASTPPGELPPPPPRVCFGRDELIETIIDLAETLTPVALIGAGGIGKTSVALVVLHHDRIRQRFGDDRRFIRCDQFPTSRIHFLSRLSEVIGAGVDNPKDLVPLRPFLSSREMILFLDNAESVLDPKGTDAKDIYAIVEELSQFKNICLCITSRISTIPRHFKHPTVPTLSMESACNIFYGIHDSGGQSDIISNLLEQLDFHALSITLLATTASHNMWDYDRLAQEWATHCVHVLQTDYNESLATTIELSLDSPTFQELGPDARNLLSVIAFFPQGINEKNLSWLLPTISNTRTIFDKFCVLSLTHRSNGFVTMLAPLRDYLCPKDPLSSLLLCTTKEHYFSRLSVCIAPGKPGFEEAQWIMFEDVNVEHLLDVFTTICTNSNEVWDVCGYFMQHLLWHKPRQVILGPKIEGLPDSHPSKPGCLFRLSQLVYALGNHVERKRLLTHALKLWREQGNDCQVAEMLKFLADANRFLGLHEEGIEQVKEALEITSQSGDKLGQANSWEQLAWLLYEDKQLDAAEEAASKVVSLLPDKSDQFQVCKCHRLLGNIHSSKGETEKAITHFEIALKIASPFNWNNERFWTHFNLAELFFNKNQSDDACTHIKSAKSLATNDAYNLGRAMELQARVWDGECKFEEAKSEALDAANMFKKIGAVKDVERCRSIASSIQIKAVTSLAK